MDTHPGGDAMLRLRPFSVLLLVLSLLAGPAALAHAASFAALDGNPCARHVAGPATDRHHPGHARPDGAESRVVSACCVGSCTLAPTLPSALAPPERQPGVVPETPTGCGDARNVEPADPPPRG